MKTNELRIAADVGNRHVERQYDDNITLVRQVRFAETRLEKDQYYARMLLDPNGGLKDEKGLEQCAGQTFITKFFQSVYLFPSPSFQLWLVRVNDAKKCWVCL